MDKIKEVSFSLQNPLVRRGSWEAAVPDIHAHAPHSNPPTALSEGLHIRNKKYGIMRSRPDVKWKKKTNGKDLENEHPPPGG